MIHAQTLDLVQRNQDSSEEKLVLLLQGQSEPVDDRPKNFEELSNAIESLGLVNELEEDVVDGAANVRAEVEEFSVYAMESCLQKVAFSGIFGVEQFKKLRHVSKRSRKDDKNSELTLSTKL